MNKIKAIDIINKRDSLSTEISKYWNIMRVENIVGRNYKRNYDLKALFTMIKELADQRVTAKLQLLCLNLGITKFSDLPLDSNQINIFKLCELTEQKVQLGQIKTLSPKLKAAKGKNNLSKTEVLTSNWIKARVDEIDLQIVELKKKMTEFNESTELDMSKAPLALVA